MSPPPEAPTPLHSPPSSSPSHSEESKPKKQKRSKSGCLTCRLRKKRCDETRPVCAMCTRLGLECLGFSSQRPEWTRKQEVVSDVMAGMKRDITATNSAKMNAYWSERAATRLSQGAEGSDTSPPVETAQSYPSQPDMAWATPSGFIDDLSDILSYPAPQAGMVDLEHSPFSIPRSASASPEAMQDAQDVINIASRSPSPPGQLIDPTLLELLGLGAPRQVTDMTYFPLVSQPSTASITPFPTSPVAMRYFHHYLTVIMPYQWIFERKVLSDTVAPLAFTNPVVFESLIALAALHMGAKRKRTLAQIGPPDSDLTFAEGALQRSIHNLRKVTFNQFGTHEMIIAAMSVSSFHLFDGGNRKGWTEAVDLCRKSLAAVLHGCRDWNSEDPASRLQLSALVKRLGHLLSPLIWTDILTTVTEGIASQFVSVYRILLLDDQNEEMGELLKETVMGCDSTTRLAMAETIALSEWKEKATEAGRLSIRDLMEHATAIERLLAQRRWRERHLFDSEDTATQQRREVSNIFFHAAKVLLAITVNGCFPTVVEVATAVRETADAFRSLDCLNLEGADRALVFPTVIAGCHADCVELQNFFRARFLRLGEEAAAFGNTQNALRLMEEVWRRRDGTPLSQEVHWRKVMFELNPEGLLLI